MTTSCYPLTNPPRLPLRGVFRRVGHLLFRRYIPFYSKAQCITKKIIGLTLCNVFFVTIKCDLVRKPLRNAGIAFKSCVINFNVGIYKLSYHRVLRGSQHNEFLSSRILVTFDTSLAPSRQFFPQPITATGSSFQPPNVIFHSPPYKRLE